MEDRTESLLASRQNEGRNQTILQDSTVRTADDDEDEEDDEESEDDHATEWFGMADVAEPKKPAPSAVPSRPRPEVVKSTVALAPPPRPQPQRPPAPVAKAVPAPKPAVKEVPVAPRALASSEAGSRR